MIESIMQIIQSYQILAIAVITFLAVMVLLRMQWQLKKINRNFSLITNRMQDYFNVVLQEDEKEVQDDEIEERYSKRYVPQEVYLSRQEKEMLLSNTNDREVKVEDEAVFNSVLQEYFS